jgi:hypothetical protein
LIEVATGRIVVGRVACPTDTPGLTLVLTEIVARRIVWIRGVVVGIRSCSFGLLLVPRFVVAAGVIRNRNRITAADALGGVSILRLVVSASIVRDGY